MRSRTLDFGVLLAGFAAMTVGGQAVHAQTRVQAPAVPPPQPPGIQKPDVDPTNQAIAALKLQLDALRDSVGRQVVVLHFTPEESGTWTNAMNNQATNSQRAEFKCTKALGERYGRVLSRSPEPHGNMWYFSHVVCETKP